MAVHRPREVDDRHGSIEVFRTPHTFMVMTPFHAMQP
jgi:hypothetical protein